MVFSEEFLEELKDKPLEGTLRLIGMALSEMVEDEGWSDSEYQVLLEAYALITEIWEIGLLDIEEPFVHIKGEMGDDCSQIVQYLRSLEQTCTSQASKLRLQSFKSHFKTVLGAGFVYEFSTGDLERVQELINQLRGLISATNDLEKDHQRRLLSRLERLQSEIHKKVSDLDRFWGLIGDAGVVLGKLGKLGKNAKPIVDRIREVADIVWQTQSRAEELPSGIQPPLLTHKETAETQDE